MSRFVYFISDGKSVKIGIAGDVGVRMRALQTSHPRHLTLLHVIECDDAHQLEREFHRHFSARRLVGEWFRIKESDLASAMAIRSVRYKSNGDQERGLAWRIESLDKGSRYAVRKGSGARRETYISGRVERGG